MDYKRLLGLLAILYMCNGIGMEESMAQGGVALAGSSVVVPNASVTTALASIPAEEAAIWKAYLGHKQGIATALLMKLNAEYSEESISAKRELKLEKAMKKHQKRSDMLLYKGATSLFGAIGGGYYTCKGCKTPETTVITGLVSAGLALWAIKCGYDWYKLSKPTHHSIALEIKQKMSPTYDARPSVLAKIIKIFNPKKTKEK